MSTLPIPPVRYEDGRALTLVGLCERFNLSNLAGLPLLWQRFVDHGGDAPWLLGKDSYGVCYHPDERGGFDYLAAVELSTDRTLAPGFTTLALAPQHYAVFEHHGSLQALKGTFQGLFAWLAQSGLQQADAALFERYPAGFDPTDPNAAMEIWVPLQRK